MAEISQNNFALRDSALRNTQETKAKVVGIHILGRPHDIPLPSKFLNLKTG